MSDQTAHPWSERLSDLLDDTLAGSVRAEVESHVAACPDCTAMLAALGRVRERAGSLAELDAPVDLWPGIARRIAVRGLEGVEATDHAPPAAGAITLASGHAHARTLETAVPWWRGGITLALPQLVAACLAIVLLSGGAVWLTMRSAPVTPETARQALATDASLAANEIPTGYEHTIRDLEATLAEHRTRLDPATITVLEANLAIIDQAIGESRAALASDPESPYLYRHLNRQMQQKVDLLRQATVVAYAGP